MLNRIQLREHNKIVAQRKSDKEQWPGLLETADKELQQVGSQKRRTVQPRWCGRGVRPKAALGATARLLDAGLRTAALRCCHRLGIVQ